MPLTKQQFDELGYQFYHYGKAPGYSDQYFAVNPTKGIVQEVDPSTLSYISGIGVSPTTIDRNDPNNPLGKYNTSGGSTITPQYLEGAYEQVASKQRTQAEEARVSAGNAAIKSGNVLQVEQSFPGYTLWNGAFVEKSKIPELEKQGAKVQDGNVVGTNVPGLGGQPMSPEQQAATSEQARQQAIQQAGQPQSQTNATMRVAGASDATLGSNPEQVGGRFGTQQFGRLGNDVYEIMSDGSRRKVTEAEFNQKLKAQGLNLDVLPQLDLNENVGDAPGGTGVGINDDGSLKDPSDFLTDYKNIIQELGLSDIKSEFEKNKQEYSDLQDKKNAEIADINDNPWLSEGIRLKEVEKINTKYELKENTISNLMKYNESLYEEGLAQAKFLASGMQEDRNKMLDLALKREEAMADLLKDNPSDYKEVQGGLYNIKSGQWIIPPKPATSGGDGAGLTPGQINTTINSIASAFDNEQIVKDYNAANTAYQSIKSIGPDTKSPADDISFIYAFAKVMDPNSVVREGEYDTIQKYAQSWADTFGFKANRIFSNTNFLSSDAKNKMLNAVSAKIQTLDKQYDNVYNEYQRQIQDASQGKIRSITDYSKAFEDNLANTELDIIETINSNKDQYRSREDLINALLPVFPEFSLDDVARYVYTYIPDKK